MLRLEKLELRQEEFFLNANLDVAAGRRVAVVGPSGAGKSTLLAAIAGFLYPRSGRVIWRGEDITERAPGSRPIAMLFQDGNLFPHLSVAKNVALGLRPDARLDAAQWTEVSGALSRVGLGGFEERKPSSLSGGQQSRAALARVVVQKKPLMLLDEPFAALGPALRGEMLDLVSDLAQETDATMLIVSHEPSDARRIADEVILVADGVAQPPVATAELLDNPPRALRVYLG